MTVPAKMHMAVSNVFDIIGTPTITPATGSVDSNTPAANILDSRRGKIVRINSNTSTVAIKGSSATTYSTGCFAMWGANANSDTTIRIRFWDDVNQTGSITYDSTATAMLIATGWGTMVPGVDPWGDVYSTASPQLYADFFDQIQFKSYQIDIDNSTTSLNPLDIGLIYSGVTWTPTLNIDYGFSVEWVDDSRHTRTAGAGLYTGSMQAYRKIDFKLSWLTQDDQDRLSHFMENFGGKSNDILLSIDPTDTTRMKIETSMICRRANNSRISRTDYARRSGSYVFEEI